MRRVAVLAVITGMITASCSGGHSASTIPAAGGSGAQSPMSLTGAHSAKAKSGMTAPPGWATTGTGTLALANAADLGELAGTKPVNVTLGLQMRNVDAAKAAIAARQVISRDAFVSQYAPSSDQVAAATSYLRTQGFSSVTAAPNNMLVTASASAATVEKAFNTSLHAFNVSGKSFFANTQPAYVPTALGGNVVAVLGLTNIAGYKASHPTQPATGVTPGTFGADGTPHPTGCTQNVNGQTG